MGVKISVCVRNEISGSPIDNVYVKSSLSMSNFLNSFLTKLRISAHSLAIEKGRYNNTPKEQRFCKHCPTSVENESHFILYCSRFDNLRLTSDYIFPSSRVDADLIKDILNPSNINNAKLICRFLKEANAIHN
jgi:hypothetical protein